MIYPCLPHKRLYNFFKIGDFITVYLEINDKTSGWFKGRVVDGYRHHDGCVSFRLNNNIGPQEDDEIFKGYWGCSSAIPTIMKFEEYLFFFENPAEYVEWWIESTSVIGLKDLEFIPIGKESLGIMAKKLLIGCSSDEQAVH